MRAIDLNFMAPLKGEHPEHDVPSTSSYMFDFCHHCGSPMAWRKGEQSGFSQYNGRQQYWWYWVCTQRAQEIAAPKTLWERIFARDKRSWYGRHDWACLISTATGREL